jgi:biopolymer transport protein ExbD
MRRPSPYPVQRGFDVMMTPMIDVVFLLLVFFVCTSGFDRPEEVLQSNLSLPGTGGVQAVPREEDDFEEIVIRLRREDEVTEYRVGERRIASEAELRAVLSELAAIDTSLAVVLDAAPGVPLGDVIDAYDGCRAAGFSRIQFAAH